MQFAVITAAGRSPGPRPSRFRVGTLLAAVLALAACTAPPPPPPPPTPPPPAREEPRSFTLVATGDVLIHQDGSLTDGAARGGGYDFAGVLAPVAPLLREADLAVCHLETPVAEAGGPYRGYPSFAVQPEIVDALAGAGYDLCSTASNHSLDDGFDGLVRTLDALDAAGVAHTGTHRTAADAEVPRIVDVAGVRVGHVAVTFGLNGVPEPQEWMVDDFAAPDVSDVLADAARARRGGAEVVIVSVHCCREYDPEPSTEQVDTVRALLASPDVDLVLGHHAHVMQPFERIDGKWAAYGLGNHIAQHSTRGFATEDSVLARFTFTRGADGRFVVTLAEAVPVGIELGAGSVRVVPADPATRDRVAAVLDARGARAAGLQVVAG